MLELSDESKEEIKHFIIPMLKSANTLDDLRSAVSYLDGLLMAEGDPDE